MVHELAAQSKASSGQQTTENGRRAPTGVTAAPSPWREATPASPCPVCGATAGCLTRRLPCVVACLTTGGPLTKMRVGRHGDNAGKTFFIHRRDPETGKVYTPV